MPPALQRAYSLLTIKSVDAELRRISGMASTPELDRMGDIVESRGASFQPELPLLLFHDSQRPVGIVALGAPGEDGIPFSAQLPEIPEPGTLRERIAEAWQSVRAGLIKGVSIGFRPFEDGIELLKSGGLRFTKFEILELSLVAIPANASATIHTIKSFDAPHLAALGLAAEPSSPGGASPSRAAISARKDHRTKVKTYAEQIKDYSEMRNAAQGRIDELMKSAAAESRTLDEKEGEEYDELESEVGKIDKHLSRLRVAEKSNADQAKAVVAINPETASSSRGGGFVQVRSPLPPGIEFARYILCKIAQYKEGIPALEVARQRYPDNPRIANAFIQRAAVPAAGTTDSAWLGALVDPQNLADEFIEYLRPQTIVGKFGAGGIPSLRRVPFNVRIVGQDSGATANWVGQGKAKPLTRWAVSAITLTWAKLAAITVLTEELARFSSPSAEALVRDELAAAVREKMDTDFIDPSVAAVANVSPASITNGLTALTSSGTDADAVRADLNTLIAAFIEENQDPTGLVLIMPNTVALSLSLMVNTLGQAEFPNLTMNGGTLQGIPVITSQFAAMGSAGAGNLVIAVNAREIFLSDDGGVSVDVSREASLEMSDAPAHDSTTPTAASLVSMWQTNSIALRAERFINWARRRTGAVQYMDDVGWGGAGSPAV